MSIHLLETREFPFGPGLFETIRLENGKPVFLKEHWERLSASCKALELPCPWTFEEVEQKFGTGTHFHGRNSKKMCACPEFSGRNRLIYKNEEQGPELSIQFLASKPIPDSWTLFPVTITPHPQALHKITDRQTYEDWHETAIRNGANDALLITNDGEILETTRANIFLVKNGKLYTPVLDGRILPGLARRRIMEEAKALEIPVYEKLIRKEDVSQADEIFVTNSIIELLRVTEIAGLWKNTGLSDGFRADMFVEKLR